MDLPKGLGLFVASYIVPIAVIVPVQVFYHFYTQEYLRPKNYSSMFNFGISTLSLAFICLNPFFEELIVRAYAMSEIIGIGRSRWAA